MTIAVANIIEHLPAIERITKDARQAAAIMSDAEARYLVDRYYQEQENRKRAGNQEQACEREGEPNAAVAWLRGQSETLETRVKSLLNEYAKGNETGRWSMGVVGIGPVIAAGLLAHIDPHRTTGYGRLFAFAGLAPGVQWSKGQKRPWNASLKVLCWKIGESFVKTCNNEASFYGPIYVQRKAYETAKNEAGDYAGQAAEKLERFNIGKTTEAYGHYSAGRLPPAHIHARAKRYAVKMFLSHWLEVRHWVEFGVRLPSPYAIAHLGHQDYIAPPNFDFE